MSKLKLTPKFPSSINPVHHGVYKVSYHMDWFYGPFPEIGYSKWNGSRWHVVVDNIDDAARTEYESVDLYMAESFTWQGIEKWVELKN